MLQNPSIYYKFMDAWVSVTRVSGQNWRAMMIKLSDKNFFSSCRLFLAYILQKTPFSRGNSTRICSPFGQSAAIWALYERLSIAHNGILVLCGGTAISKEQVNTLWFWVNILSQCSWSRLGLLWGIVSNLSQGRIAWRKPSGFLVLVFVIKKYLREHVFNKDQIKYSEVASWWVEVYLSTLCCCRGRDMVRDLSAAFFGHSYAEPNSALWGAIVYVVYAV